MPTIDDLVRAYQADELAIAKPVLGNGSITDGIAEHGKYSAQELAAEGFNRGVFGPEVSWDRAVTEVMRALTKGKNA